jgi:hypothetical protein
MPGKSTVLRTGTMISASRAAGAKVPSFARSTAADTGESGSAACRQTRLRTCSGNVVSSFMARPV